MHIFYYLISQNLLVPFMCVVHAWLFVMAHPQRPSRSPRSDMNFLFFWIAASREAFCSEICWSAEENCGCSCCAYYSRSVSPAATHCESLLDKFWLNCILLDWWCYLFKSLFKSFLFYNGLLFWINFAFFLVYRPSLLKKVLLWVGKVAIFLDFDSWPPPTTPPSFPSPNPPLSKGPYSVVLRVFTCLLKKGPPLFASFCGGLISTGGTPPESRVSGCCTPC